MISISEISSSLQQKAIKGLLSGGVEEVFNADTQIDAGKNGRVLVLVSATDTTLTLDDPDIIGASFITIIRNTGTGISNIVGLFDDGSTNFSLKQNQSVCITCNGEVHRILIQNGVTTSAPLYKIHTSTGSVGPYTLQAVPVNDVSLTIHCQGLAQPKDGTAYSVVGDQLTFIGEGPPVGTSWEETIIQSSEIGVPSPETVGAIEIKAADVDNIRTKLDVSKKQSTVVDVTSGRGLIVGAFGLGGSLGIASLTLNTPDFNAIDPVSGSYYVNASTNYPTSAATGYGTLKVDRIDPSATTFTFIEMTTGDIFQRVKYNSAWLAWQRVFSQRNIIGTVSQASGIPTGAIVERGSNSNGNYVRFADGTQLCNAIVIQSGSYAVGSSTASPSTYAAAFVGQYIADWRGVYMSGAGGTGDAIYGLPFVTGGASAQLLQTGVKPSGAHPQFTLGSFAAASVVWSGMALGRWY